MIRFSGGALALALTVGAVPAAAQVRGLPVVNSGPGIGIGIGAEVAKANAAAGGETAYGANVSLSAGIFGVSGAISRSGSDDAEIWSQGATVSMRLFGGPFVPIRVTAQAGAGRWEVGDVTTTHVPVSLGIAATIPNPLFAIKPWLAPRISFNRVRTTGDTDTGSDFGISGGIELAFLNGLTLRASYDRLLVDGDAKPGIISFGLGMGVWR